ncbi:MAG: molybdopterin-dependent oxidoreductase [Candidatus Bathyarchaeia archaeon]
MTNNIRITAQTGWTEIGARVTDKYAFVLSISVDMQVLKQHKWIVLIGVLLVAVLLVSLFVVENAFKPSSSPTPSPAPSGVSLTPTPTGTASSQPTMPATSATPLQTATPSPASDLFPGEVSQYNGQSLTPINGFLSDIAEHPDVAIMGTQILNQSTYQLSITGLVNQPIEYTYSDVVNNFTPYQNVATLYCVEGWSVTCLWQGTLVSDLIKEAGVSSNANTLIFTASDGYTTSLPISYVEQNNITLAYKMNNVTLPAAAGFPFVLIPSDQYGYKWIKWVTQIEVSNDSSYLGYWESRGYPNNATVSTGGDGAAVPSVFSVALTVGVFAVGVLMTIAVYRILVRNKRRVSRG